MLTVTLLIIIHVGLFVRILVELKEMKIKKFFTWPVFSILAGLYTIFFILVSTHLSYQISLEYSSSLQVTIVSLLRLRGK